MTAFKTTSRVGPRGELRVTVPADLANAEVQVTVERAENGREGPPGARPAPPRMSREEWVEFVRSTAGSLPDLPDVERPGPGAYEARDLDW